MYSRIKLNEGDTLQLDRSETKGTMSETDINHYIIINEEGEVVGKIIHEDHTSINGFHRTQHVKQTDSNGKIVLETSWSS